MIKRRPTYAQRSTYSIATSTDGLRRSKSSAHLGNSLDHTPQSFHISSSFLISGLSHLLPTVHLVPWPGISNNESQFQTFVNSSFLLLSALLLFLICVPGQRALRRRVSVRWRRRNGRTPRFLQEDGVYGSGRVMTESWKSHRHLGVLSNSIGEVVKGYYVLEEPGGPCSSFEALVCRSF